MLQKFTFEGGKSRGHYIHSSGANDLLDDHENVARSRSRSCPETARGSRSNSRSSRFPVRIHQTVEVPPRLHEERRHGRVPPQRIQNEVALRQAPTPSPPPPPRRRSRAADRPRPAPPTRRRRRIRSASFPGRRTSPGTPRPSSERTRRAGPAREAGSAPSPRDPEDVPARRATRDRPRRTRGSSRSRGSWRLRPSPPPPRGAPLTRRHRGRP